MCLFTTIEQMRFIEHLLNSSEQMRFIEHLQSKKGGNRERLHPFLFVVELAAAGEQPIGTDAVVAHEERQPAGLEDVATNILFKAV